MIMLELVITLSAMLLAFFVSLVMLQKSSTRKHRVRQDFDTLQTARQLNCDTRSEKNMTKLGLKPFYIKTESPEVIQKECKTIFYLGVFYCLLFVGWAGFMAAEGLMNVAALSFAIAVVSVIALILREHKIIRGNTEVDRLRRDISAYENNYSPAHVETKGAKPVVEKPQVTRSTARESGVVSEQLNITEFYDVADKSGHVHQDATLKRHVISHLIAELQAEMGLMPTDCTLKRHYVATLKAKLDDYLSATLDEVSESQPAAETLFSSVLDLRDYMLPGNRIAHFLSDDIHLPEDATLRRHFLAGLHDEIEQCHGERPSDSSLKRHFDNMIDSEMDEVIHHGHA